METASEPSSMFLDDLIPTSPSGFRFFEAIEEEGRSVDSCLSSPCLEDELVLYEAPS